MEKGERGKIAAQVIDATRKSLDLLDKVSYGEIVFYVKDYNVWRMEVTVSKMLEGNGSQQKIIKEVDSHDKTDM